jgi:hypothetical protein
MWISLYSVESETYWRDQLSERRVKTPSL